MINLKIGITNPWSERFDSLLCREGPITNHKYWEFQVMRTNDVLVVDISYTVKQDHAGFNVWLGLLGYSVNFIIYDIRHWDYKNNQWYS
jgi:hypothetical protein